MYRTRRLILAQLFMVSSLISVSAYGASMEKVEQNLWHQSETGLPNYVNMYIYVPDALTESPPIVVAPHHCQGTANSTYSEMASLRTIADEVGFLMVIPEATGQNCWDAGSDRSLTHGGGGDTGAIVQMVKYTIDEYSADQGRVYTVGGSSGGIMTEALLGVYPDVFMAGVSLMGVPCGCWAEGYNDVVGNGSSAQWSSCAGGTVTKTAQQWGDLVRSYFPDYTGHRPRLQHWHGTDDTTLNYKVVEEDIKEWTNLLELDADPDGTDTPSNGVTREYWTSSSCDFTVYEVFRMSGVGHNVPFDGPAIAAYFGLDQPGKPDPEAAACAIEMNGSGGNDAGASGGASGSSSGGSGTSSSGGSGNTTSSGGTAAGGGSSLTGGDSNSTASGGVASNGTATGGTSSGTGGSTNPGSGDDGLDDGSGCSCAQRGVGRHEIPGVWLLGWGAVALFVTRRTRSSRTERWLR